MKKFFVANKWQCVAIAVQCLIVLSLLALSIITPRTSLVLYPSDLATEDMKYATLEDELLVYEIPYHWEHTSSTFSLASGAYTVYVTYTAQALEESFADTQSTAAAYWYDAIDFSSASYSDAVISDSIALLEGATLATGTIWIQPLYNTDDLAVTVYYTGTCEIAIESIALTESIVYRLLCCLAVGLLFLGIDALVLFYRKTNHKPALQKRVTAFFGIVLFASFPLMTNFAFLGHDYAFHLARIISLAEEFQNGQFPVRMLTEMLNGYSYATPLFYCDIFLYLPALLYKFMVPLYICYQIYLWAITLLTAGIAYFSFHKVTKSKEISLVGTALYVLSAYRLICIYTRAAVGEYTAMAFFPLVVAGMYAIYTEEKPTFKDWILLTLAMAGIVSSHILSTQIAVLFLVMFCLAFLRKTFEKHRFIALLKATACTVALCSWFLVPFLLSTKDSVKIFTSAIQTSIQSHGIYLMQLFSVFMTYIGDSVANYATSEMPLTLGLSLTVGLGCCIYCALNRNVWQLQQNKDYRLLRIFFAFSLISCAFTLQAFPWDAIQFIFGESIASFFTAIQFPWRYLSMASLFATLATLFALKLVRTSQPSYYKPLIATMLASMVLVNGMYYLNMLNDFPIDSTLSTRAATAADETVISTMNIGAGEYLLTGTDVNLFSSADPLTGSDDVLVLSYQSEGSEKYLSISNTAETAQTVTFPVQNYSNYHVYDTDTMEEFEISNGYNNNIRVTLPAGYTGTLVLCYEPPLLWRITEFISLITALLIVFYACRRYLPRRKKAAKTT